MTLTISDLSVDNILNESEKQDSDCIHIGIFIFRNYLIFALRVEG